MLNYTPTPLAMLIRPFSGTFSASRPSTNMNGDALGLSAMDTSARLDSLTIATDDTPRMQYRSRPVSVAVDPVSLVISECISITSAIQKHARSQHSSVSAILGGNPNPIQLGPPSPSIRGRAKSPSGDLGGDGAQDGGLGNRWGLRGQRGKSMQDNPMIAGFGRLRHEIAGRKDIRSFDAPSLLAPFLHVIQAKGTAAPITILALGALRKFLAYGFVCPESPRFAHAMQSLSAAVTHCQFDISDSGQVEVVLLMILNLMEDMMSGPGGDILSDESVCDMMGRGLAICSQPRFSPVLRRTAEAAMVRMCQIIFEDVKHIEVEAGSEAEALDQRTEKDMDHVRINNYAAERASATPGAGTPALGTPLLGTPSAETPAKTSTETSKNTQSSAGGADIDSADKSATETVENSRQSRDAGNDGNGADSSSDSDESESVDLKPYSLPSVRELFRVLVNFLDPHDRHHTDTMRVMAMRIIHVALEVAGPFIARHPALASIAEDRLCCYLFQLVRSDNMAILQESLIVAGTLLATCRPVLKLQQELFLSYLVACLHPTVEIPREPGIDPSLYAGIPQTPKLVKPPSTPAQSTSGRSTPVPVKDRQKLGLEGGARKPDARQAMVEGLGVLSRMPTFIVELFVNYDCDADRSDLCEDTIGLLSRNALPDSATWSTTSVPPLCLDALLRFIQFIAERLHDDPNFAGYPNPDVLREQRQKKKTIVRGTAKFNEKPMAGLGYLEAQGIIRDAKNPEEVARFLKGTSRVSKAVLGDYLSKRGNEAILKAFLDQFDFRGKRVDEAMRALLETFRLPGEAPLIAAIVEAFSERYMQSANPPEVADNDAVFVLTYAIILLNTDQHNPNMKAKRMTPEDFAKNLRGTNNGKDFDPAYVQEIYDAIKSNEIILPDEHDNKHAFDYAWRELLLKTESAGPLTICNTNIYDADMFAATWKPIVSTLSYVFMSASDDAVFARIVTGFDECARIAAKYGNQEALDQIVYCLSHMTTLAADMRFNTALNTEVQAGDGSVMVSELAVKLGRDFRAQLATLVLFRVVTGNEGLLNKSWKQIIRILLNLFVNSLAQPFSSPELPKLPIPAIPFQSPSQVIDRGARSAETGFFSAFTSYISSYAADDPPEPSDEELESTLCTVDCVKSCKVETVFSNIAQLPSSSNKKLVQALLDQLPENNHEAVIAVKQEGMPPPPPSGEQQTSSTPLKYDPTVAFLLEFATRLAIKDDEAVSDMSKDVFDTMQGILRDPAQWHPITVSRATFYALQLLKASYDHDYANVPYLLHSIATLPPHVLAKTAELALTGLTVCIDQPGPLRSEMMTSPDFWKLLHTLTRNSKSTAMVFGILEKGTSGNPPAIRADNYDAAIGLLNEFATAARPHPAPESESNPRRPELQNEKPKKKDEKAIARGCKAIHILQGMTARIPQLIEQSQLESSEAWSAYWLPVFQSLVTQCTNPCREVRQLAFSALQRALLSPELTSNDPKEWTAIFESVLFPLIQRLLKPEVFSSDRDGMSEMRVQAASLLCKVFLQYLVLLSEWEGMLDLWVKVIDILDRLTNSGQGDLLEEAVRENLKNVLLFMASSGHLVSPKQDTSKERLWTETWRRVDRFLPDLRSELALDGDGEEVEKPTDEPEGSVAEAAAAAAASTDEGKPEQGEGGQSEPKA